MPFVPPLVLVKRLVLGRKIFPSEEDQNKTDIENAINSFAAQLAAALNANGTLKPGSVNTAAIQDRAVTLAKLAFLSSFYAVDTGAANAMVISFSPPLVAYVEGLIFWVKAKASNSGPTTLNVDGNGLITVKKLTSLGLEDLVLGEILANNVYTVVYDGTRFLLLNPSAKAAVQQHVFASTVDVSEAVANIDLSLTLPAGATEWQTVELFAKIYLDSAANLACTGAVTLKWNCGVILDTPVTISPLTGSGNSGQVDGVNGDNQAYSVTQFSGIVPGTIKGLATLSLRATLLMGGSFDVGVWSFWATATCK